MAQQPTGSFSAKIPLVKGIPPAARSVLGSPSDISAGDLRNFGAQAGRMAQPVSGGQSGTGGKDTRRDPQNRTREEEEINRVAHRLAHTQVGITRILEQSLRDLDALLTQTQAPHTQTTQSQTAQSSKAQRQEIRERIEVVAEKIRGILRSTEPRRQGRQGGGSGS